MVNILLSMTIIIVVIFTLWLYKIAVVIFLFEENNSGYNFSTIIIAFRKMCLSLFLGLQESCNWYIAVKHGCCNVGDKGNFAVTGATNWC